MGIVEDRFAAGAAAFRAGTARDAAQHFDWLCGWDSALAGKQTRFREYIKQRQLHRQQFHATSMPISLERLQEIRQRRIAAFEAEFPDFREAYNSLRKDMRMSKA